MSKYALISVSDKSDIIELASELISRNYKIITSGGTYQHLRNAFIPAIEVSSITGMPEILGGRVKTLHPALYGSVLAKRDGSHDDDINKHNLPQIDIVIVNLYPFKQTVDSGADHDTVIENIDIGGVSLLRAAAKNYKYVWCVSNPDQYSHLLNTLDYHTDSNAVKLRRKFASDVFKLTYEYDKLITDYFDSYEIKLEMEE